jgi:hypothetical protein
VVGLQSRRRAAARMPQPDPVHLLAPRTIDAFIKWRPWVSSTAGNSNEVTPSPGPSRAGRPPRRSDQRECVPSSVRGQPEEAGVSDSDASTADGVHDDEERFATAQPAGPRAPGGLVARSRPPGAAPSLPASRGPDWLVTVCDFVAQQADGESVDNTVRLIDAFGGHVHKFLDKVIVLVLAFALLAIAATAAFLLLPGLSRELVGIALGALGCGATTHVIRLRKEQRQANAAGATGSRGVAGSVGRSPEETNEPCQDRLREPTTQAGAGDGAASNEGNPG